MNLVNKAMVERCEVCKKPLNECVCCPECGHICSLDNGENYCPGCFPAKTKSQ